MLWALYYDSRRVYTSEDGEWQDAPPWGVQALVVSQMPTQERVIFEGDFYFIPANATEPFGGDQWGVVDKLIVEGHMTGNMLLADFTPEELIGWGVKFGRMLDRAKYEELARFIREDARLKFPPLTDGTTTLDSRRA